MSTSYGGRRQSPPGLVVISGDATPTVAAWSFYRRTKAHPDPADEQPQTSHIEFLIDRFGYVRAKWRADENSLPSADILVTDVETLAAEPRLLPSPEEHVH